jgi:putative heme-binding domain-containing protein
MYRAPLPEDPPKIHSLLVAIVVGLGLNNTCLPGTIVSIVSHERRMPPMARRQPLRLVKGFVQMNRMLRRMTLGTLLLLFVGSVAYAEDLKLGSRDTIALVGNTLAERMQHDGTLESLIQASHPQLELKLRNLGFSGDELELRLRSQDFGSPDEWLKKVGATVVFAFFGSNEAYQGESGLAKFEEQLRRYIQHLKSQSFVDGKPVRVVLVSPIAHEDLGNTSLPDGRSHNRLLEIYTAAMQKVAASEKVPFVDLFHPTAQKYSSDPTPWTINGIHLNDHGNRQVAQQIFQSLFPKAASGPRPATFAKVQAAVQEKDFYWFQRYRTTDGYSIYGGRADLRFVEGQSNRDVMSREMKILEQMTDLRDPAIWAAANRQDHAVDDSKTDPFIPVVTNKPGSGPDGKHLFLTGEEAIGKMTVGAGMKVNLFASEEQFPELVNPVQMAFDPKGRLWVAAWRTYPHWKPKEPMDDKLLILEDTNGDGRADVCKTFADDIHNPTGFEFWNGGVLVAQAPDLLFLKDTDGDDVADVRERVLHGLDSADTHHTASSFTFDPGGALYFQEGTFHHSQTETPWGPVRRVANGAVFRYEPKRMNFDIYTSYGFANPHGHVFDRWGQDIVHDGTGAVPYHGKVFSTYLPFPEKHGGAPTVYQQRTRPCSGTEILSSDHFPESMQDDLLVLNVIGFQGILRYQVKQQGSSLTAEEKEPILSSTDPNFRPADIEMGPDGAMYFVDWQNPIIGHMQHNLRDPSRDQVHGRVYRVTYEGRPLAKMPSMDKLSIDQLCAQLASPVNRTRYLAKLEMTGRDSAKVLEGVDRWLKGLDRNDPGYEHHRLEALWMHQQHDKVNERLLDEVLTSPEPRARAAAVTVLWAWRDRVSDVLNRLLKAATDDHGLVRLEAVRAASYLEQPEAIEVSVNARKKEIDPYLDYVLKETDRVLMPRWKSTLESNLPVKMVTDAGRRFYLQQLSTEKLLAMEPSGEVFEELMLRPGVQDGVRSEAIERLAAANGKSVTSQIITNLQQLDRQANADESVIYDLVRLLAGQRESLGDVRTELQKMATEAASPVIRQSGWLGLVAVDQGVQKVWDLASSHPQQLRDLIRAMPLISDGANRSQLYDLVTPLLQGLPEAMRGTTSKGDGAMGRFVRIELPRKGTLTLAEVEVYAEGRNVARAGKASQLNTSHGGDASRGIDGNTSEVYGRGGQTHCAEESDRPWWEVDLGEAYPIEKLAIFNRGEGFANRLNGFTLQVLDETRQVVYEQKDQPAPDLKKEYALEGGGIEGLIRRAAMDGLASVRGREEETFQKLVPLVDQPRERLAALRALRRIPKQTWPGVHAPQLLKAIFAYVEGIPTEERTQSNVLDALEMGDHLVGLLPDADRLAARRRLRELGVRVVRLGTLLERMAYDQEVLVVEAGKPIEFLFENSDMMPHNLVIAKPGSMEVLGESAEATAQEPGAAARHFVPVSDQVLLSSRLLQPNQQQRLAWVAPKEPGVYPYVCTYPGHWRRMFGALYVVPDLDQYLADPERFAADATYQPKDGLLKDRRPRTEWKLDDLAGSVASMHGRSYASAMQVFQVANCIACHKMGERGVAIGPDLTKLDDSMKPEDILKDLLNPSAKINEKYQSYQILTEDDQTITGLIVAEDGDSIDLVENPLAKSEVRKISKSDIKIRKASPVSLMPKGLLDKLSRDEILDLIALLVARGDPSHPAVQAEAHDHGHDDH